MSKPECCYTASESTMEYLYDDLYRLKEFKYNGTPYTYAYDKNGNITSFHGRAFAYYNGNNRLKNDGLRPQDFQYDGKGRATSVGGVTLKYDIFDNMIEHGAYKYAYDANNQRLRKTVAGNKTFYLTAGLDELAEYDGDNVW